MPTKLLLLFLLITFSAFAQTEKGATPLSSTQNSTLKTQNSTRAVVIGISDYQSLEIPDLQFAHRDAEAFAKWLRSPAGGNVPEANLSVLLNEKATAWQVISALGGLVESCEQGDLIYMYFSGHGDIEKVTSRQNGYLLCYDAPSTTYPSGGCLPLRYLQDLLTTISEKNARVVLVTDACHAGKLAGSAINGTQTTNAALAKQMANEIKIMSCQHDKLALEGKQWGNGRGVFSYYLIEGLTGAADRNTDMTVTLLEIGRHLEDHVSADAAPHPQTPVTLGDRNFPLARLSGGQRAEPSKGSTTMQKTDMRGFLTGQYTPDDSLTWLAFQAALEHGNFFEPADSSAEHYFQKLANNAAFSHLHGLIRRNYAAAMQDEIQQALNALLDNDPYEANAWIFNPAKYVEYPRYLRRSIELLGEKHYMYRSLLAKLHYFEGYNLAKNLGDLDNDPLRRDSLLLAAKEKFLKAVQADPEAAYPYHAIGALHYYHNPPQTDSLVWWCSQAADLSPSWLAPYLLISYEYGAALLQLEQAEQWLLLALERHPTSYLVLERLSWLKQWQGKADESIAISKEMIALKPDLFNAYSTLATTLTLMKGEYLESEQYCLESIAINPNQGWWAQTILLNNYLRTRRAAAAVEVGINCLNNNPTYSAFDKGTIVSVVLSSLVQLGRYDEAAYWAEVATTGQWGNPPGKTHIAMELGRMYLRQGDLHRAEQTLLEALTIDVSSNESWPVIFALLGEIKAIENKRDEAETYFTQGAANTGFMGHFFRDEAIFRYGRFLLAQKRPTEAVAQFREIAKILPKSYYHGYGMALLAAGRNNQTKALDWLEKSLENFWPDADSVLEEPLFKKLRKTKRFQALMKKHFPDQPKD